MFRRVRQRYAARHLSPRHLITLRLSRGDLDSQLSALFEANKELPFSRVRTQERKYHLVSNLVASESVN